ncbi:MAG: hypothetical protein ABI461_24030, partial [Polyangiaceae bacterium]
MRQPSFLLVSAIPWLLSVAAFSAGCSSSDSAGGAANGGVAVNPCAQGFAPIAGGVGCDAILPTSVCANGSSPVIGSTTCAPVGVISCPAGFIASATGWGCDVVIPDAVCTGATRDGIGSATCLPIGDCNAAFPPANATLFVNGAFTAGQIDAT